MKLANKAGIWLLELNIDENWGILRCYHITKEQIITVLSLIKKIRDFPLIISP
jgi:RNase P/RNase MRP subunit POP5